MTIPSHSISGKFCWLIGMSSNWSAPFFAPRHRPCSSGHSPSPRPFSQTALGRA
jgi:hypothetical protein